LAAGRLASELAEHRQAVERYERLGADLADLEVYTELAREDNPQEMREVEDLCARIEHELERAETEALMSGEYDRGGAILTVHAGAGGTDAQDWAEMLLRMYLRWAEREGFKAELADISPAEEAGIHSATLILSGPYAYGNLASEHGVHRLVRISPFDQSGRRHTAFARVEVLPDLGADAPIEIRPEDLKIDTFRSSGAGGQHVNKTESAVRITHLPTGLVVGCQNERSQHANRETALRILKAQLFQLQKREREEKIQSLRGESREAGFGHQIRNYVLYPFTLVKDRRTGVETSNVQAVLDGDISRFQRAWLELRARLGREPAPADFLAVED
jgi:peptide chain release factor 2